MRRVDLPEKVVYICLGVLPMAVVMLGLLALVFWFHWLLGLAFFVFLWFWVWTSYYYEVIDSLRSPIDPRKGRAP